MKSAIFLAILFLGFSAQARDLDNINIYAGVYAGHTPEGRTCRFQIESTSSTPIIRMIPEIAWPRLNISTNVNLQAQIASKKLPHFPGTQFVTASRFDSKIGFYFGIANDRRLLAVALVDSTNPAQVSVKTCLRLVLGSLTSTSIFDNIR